MRAVILGGTGAIGGATAARLAAAGWRVAVTGRHWAAMPAALTAAGVTFHSIDRADTAGIGGLVGTGADLLVDLVAFSAADVRALLPVLADVGSPVVVSSRAVYLDPEGRQVNGDQPPVFGSPVTEDTPTVPPAGEDVDPFTRDGYAPAKAAVEQTALASGLPVTILRPAKVHGRWARQARTRPFVEAMTAGVDRIALGAGSSVDHLTAATNTAALIEVVAADPGARVLNIADPDTPTAEQIVRAIASHLDWRGHLELLGPHADPEHGHNPWRRSHPFLLDTSAAHALGYRPVGTALELLAAEVDSLRTDR